MSYGDYTQYQTQLSSLGGNVTKHYGTYFFECDGVSVPLPRNPKDIRIYEVVQSVNEAKAEKEEESYSSNPLLNFKTNYMSRKAQEKAGIETAEPKTLTQAPEEFIETSNDIIETRLSWIDKLLAKAGIQKNIWKKDNDAFTVYKTSINFNGDKSTLTSAQQTEYNKHDRRVMGDLSDISHTEGMIAIYKETINHEKGWIAECENMRRLGEAVERQLGIG